MESETISENKVCTMSEESDAETCRSYQQKIPLGNMKIKIMVLMSKR